MTTAMAIPQIHLPSTNLAVAEAHAIQALAAWMDTDEGRIAEDVDIKLWMVERGWSPSKWRAWGERIAAQMALADPTTSDPQNLAHRLNSRLERLAHKAEDNNDFKHAIQASEAQAKLSKLGGYAPAAQSSIAVQINTSTAHLASDEDLIKIAKQATLNIEAAPLDLLA